MKALATKAKKKLTFPLAIITVQLIFLMVFCIFGDYDEYGAVRGEGEPADSKDDIQEYYPLFQDVHVMIFIGSGLLISFMRHYGYSSMGLTFLLAAIAIQAGTITTGMFNFINIAKERSDQSLEDEKPPYKISVGLASMIGGEFTAASVIVTFSILLGHTSPLQLLVIALIECVCYSANESLNLQLLQAQDPGGSMQIHVFGTYYGLTVSLLLYRRRTKSAVFVDNTPSYFTNIFVMIGTLFLWLFWPSFNAVGLSDDSRHRAIVNTYYSLTACTVVTFALSKLLSRDNKFQMIHIQNSTLAGGVAVGSCCHMVLLPWAAVLLGCCAAVVSVCGFEYLTPFIERRLHIMDAGGANNIHGLPGILSAIAAAIAAGIAEHNSSNGFIDYGNSLYTVFPARAPQGDGVNCSLTDTELSLGVVCGDGRSPASQAGYQLAFLLSSLIISIAGGCIAGVFTSLSVLESPSADQMYSDHAQWTLPDDDDDNYSAGNDYEVMSNTMTTQTDNNNILMRNISDTTNGAPQDLAKAASMAAHVDYAHIDFVAQ